MNELIEEALKKVKEERLLIDKLISEDEKESTLTLDQLKNKYRSIFFDTNALVGYMLENYPQEELMSAIMSGHDEMDEETFDRTTLCFLLSSSYRENMIETVFEEENNRFLYAVYLWFYKDNKIDKEEKESLHKYINLRATKSSLLRNYFAGEQSKLDEISRPETTFGPLSNFLALDEYYKIIERVIHESNCTEMYEGEEEYETAFKAQKLFLYIQFTAICAEMIARGIEFPTSQEEISDFTRKVLKESSTLANRFICASGMKKTRLI